VRRIGFIEVRRMTNVDDLLRALRDEESRVPTPPRVEQAVLAAWDADHAAPTPRSAAVPAWRAMGAIAAAVMLAVTLTMLGTALRGLVESPVRASTALVFVGEPFHRGEDVRVVRMRLPASTLSAIGVRSMTGGLDEVVDVDVIVGEDGVARAIRLGM
jgi:hypothetical protein